MIKKFKSMFFLIVFFAFPVICHAIDFNCNDKYFSFIAQINDALDKPSSTKDLEEEEVIDPSQSFKLIGIYLLSNKPKALIKNELNSDESAREYGIGDFLDDGQTVSIAKILFKPTSRVELIDKDGLIYLMKPYSPAEEGGSVSASSSTSKIYPNYSSKTKSSSYYKSKKTDTKPTLVPSTPSQNITTTTTTTTTQSSPTETSSQPQQTQSLSSIMAIEPESDASAPSPPPPSNTSPPPENAGSSIPASDQPNGLDVSRPANPFGE